MEPDLSLLYSELDLPLDCTLEEFKCAYRRRISELHPDRKGEHQAPEAQEALLALISTYVAVNRFHRRHGRMPGAAPRSASVANRAVGGGDSHPLPMASRASLPVPVPSSDHDATERSTRPTWKFVILFLALLVLLASWDLVTLASQ